MYFIGEKELPYEWDPVTQRDYNGLCNLKEMWNYMGGKGFDQERNPTIDWSHNVWGTKMGSLILALDRGQLYQLVTDKLHWKSNFNRKKSILPNAKILNLFIRKYKKYWPVIKCINYLSGTKQILYGCHVPNILD